VVAVPLQRAAAAPMHYSAYALQASCGWKARCSNCATCCTRELLAAEAWECRPVLLLVDSGMRGNRRSEALATGGLGGCFLC